MTPVVLREDTRPPAYGKLYSESASRTFYTKCVECKKRVAHANFGGAVQRQVVSMAELFPSHVQRAFAVIYHKSRAITPTQLIAAVRSHAGHDEGAEVELSATSEVVEKATAMNSKGKTMLKRVEPIVANLELLFAENPNFEAVYRNADGVYHPGPAETITKAMIAGVGPAKFQRDVKLRLQHEGDWKGDQLWS